MKSRAVTVFQPIISVATVQYMQTFSRRAVATAASALGVLALLSSPSVASVQAQGVSTHAAAYTYTAVPAPAGCTTWHDTQASPTGVYQADLCSTEGHPRRLVMSHGGVVRVQPLMVNGAEYIPSGAMSVSDDGWVVLTAHLATAGNEASDETLRVSPAGVAEVLAGVGLLNLVMQGGDVAETIHSGDGEGPESTVFRHWPVGQPAATVVPLPAGMESFHMAGTSAQGSVFGAFVKEGVPVAAQWSPKAGFSTFKQVADTEGHGTVAAAVSPNGSVLIQIQSADVDAVGVIVRPDGSTTSIPRTAAGVTWDPRALSDDGHVVGVNVLVTPEDASQFFVFDGKTVQDIIPLISGAPAEFHLASPVAVANGGVVTSVISTDSSVQRGTIAPKAS